MSVEWKYLDVKKWWAAHKMEALPSNGEAEKFSAHCPWRGRHKQAEDRCTVFSGEEPSLTCPDPACVSRTWEELTKKWQDGWMYAKPPQDLGPEEEVDSDDGFEPLGFTLEGQYVYQSARTGHIVEIGAGEHTELKLYQLVPSGPFWKHYSGGDSLSWKKIARTMMLACHDKGYYLSGETRGSGIFTDKDDTIVVNLGACLLVNRPGEPSFTPVHMANFKGKFSYASHNRITLPPPLERHETDKILPLLQMLPLSDKNEALILAGAIVCGHMAGALEWRPHFWLNSAAGGGKSDILNLVVTALQPTKFYYKGDTSPAGVRDDLKNAAGIVVIDELEKQGGSAERMSSINASRRVDGHIEMMRSSSDGSVAKVAKGGPGGQGHTVQIRCCGFFASIYYGVEMAQDFRRICFITLTNPATRPPEQKSLYRSTIRPKLVETFTPEFAMRLYSWSVINSRWILATIDFFRKHMLDHTKNAGEADQWGTVLGAAWCVTRSGDQATADDVRQMFEDAHNNMESLAWEMLDASHGEQVMQALMQSKPSKDDRTVGEVVESVRRGMAFGYADRDNEGRGWLARHGIIVCPAEDGVKTHHDLLLCPNHKQLRRFMAEEGYRDYKQAFMSRKGVSVREMVEELNFEGTPTRRVIVVPLKPALRDKMAEANSRRAITAEDVQEHGRQDN